MEGVEQPKISPKKPRNALSDALLMSRFQNFAADAAKKKPRSARFFETALRAVSINQLIRINSGTNILKSCFLHWTGSRFTYAEKEGVERSKERRNGGRVIGERGKVGRSMVGGKGGRMI